MPIENTDDLILNKTESMAMQKNGSVIFNIYFNII